MKNSTTHLALLCSIVVVLSSCASFQGKNYSSYHYVKVKKSKEEVVQSKPSDQHDEEIQAMLQNEEEGISFADEGAPVTKKIWQQKSPPVKAGDKTSAQRENAMGITDFNLKNFLVPFTGKQQQRMESQTHALFGDLDPDLRMGLLFIIGGILVGLLAFIPDVGIIFGIAAAILVIIGLVYIIKYIVENG